MEFLRFGSSIPGEYWGCCAMDIIQNFKQDPDAPASIQIVTGDSGHPQMNPAGEALFAGPTYRDLFWQRLRIGTFSATEMPNHGFLAILTEQQISGSYGKKWLAILREAGFEFIRTVTNSVYSGAQVAASPPVSVGVYKNYVFALFRGIGNGAPADPFTPPKEWTDLPRVKTEAWQALSDPQFADVGPKALALTQFAEDKSIWDSHPKKPLLTEKELDKLGCPVQYAGLRSPYPAQSREARKEAQEAAARATPASVAVPFAKTKNAA